MTRDEEIEKAADNYAENEKPIGRCDECGYYPMATLQEAFLYGARWADAHSLGGGEIIAQLQYQKSVAFDESAKYKKALERASTELFEVIRHGDEKHQEWLKNTLQKYFADIQKILDGKNGND